jgi:hypothetical protein
MPNLPDILTASSTEEALTERIALQEAQIADALAPYEPRSATYAWFDTLRAVEECVNLITVEWDEDGFDQILFSLPIAGLDQHLGQFRSVQARLVERFGQNFGARFTNLLLQGFAIATAFSQQRVVEVAAGFRTLGTMLGYLQSRRRHFVGLLHLLPRACRGSRAVTPIDTFNIFLPTIELTAIQMIGAQNALLVKLSRARLGLPECEEAELAMLDSLFLEPERARIIDMPLTEAGVEILKSKEALQADRLFSAAELRNDILAIEAAYAEFDLAGSGFPVAAAVVRRLSTHHVHRDYWIAISPADLSVLLNQIGAPSNLRSALVNPATSYMECLSTYAPLVLVDGVYRSTVALLSRFMYHWRARCLDRNKRFQIRAGFIFEDAVAEELGEQGFVVQEITRINRREFDVVTLRGGVVWNVQCKNNFVELESVENDPQRFARYNQALVRSYERALAKERDREHLLKSKMSLDVVQHMVVSRFPVICDNPRIIPFSRIPDFSERADTLLAVGSQLTDR